MGQMMRRYLISSRFVDTFYALKANSLFNLKSYFLSQNLNAKGIRIK